MKKLILFSVLALGVISSQAQEKKPAQDKKPVKAREFRQASRMDSVLQLTEAQKLKLKELNKEYHEKRMAVYTPEQRQKLEQFRASRKDFRKGGKDGFRKGSKENFRKSGDQAKKTGEFKGRKMAKHPGSRIQPPLTDSQKESMKSLREKHRNEMAVIKANEKLDEAAKKQKIKALNEATRENMRAILTPEQLEQLKKRQKEHSKDGSAR
jgi:Spy/CpxP family protein refolding chaperone